MSFPGPQVKWRPGDNRGDYLVGDTRMTIPSPPRWKPSVTVAAIIEQDGQFLLVEEHTPEGLKLNNPAGHLDPGESLVEACAREALEETTRRFEPTALIGVYLNRFERQHEAISYLRFAFGGRLGAPVPGRSLDQGIVRTLWMTVEEIRASQAHHRSPLVLQCVQDYLAGQRHALSVLHTDASVHAAGLASGSVPMA